MKRSWSVFFCLSWIAVPFAFGEPVMEVADAWRVRVTSSGFSETLTVAPPDIVEVTDERYETLAAFKGPVWRRGTPLLGTKAEVCSVADALDPDSLIVRDGPGSGAKIYELGKDYALEPRWGGFGRLEGGAIPADRAVYASYRYAMMRLDSAVLTADRRIVLRRGTPHVATPRPPDVVAGETRLGNVWLSGRIARLTEGHLFPVLETAYPEAVPQAPSAAERLLPKTYAKLRAGQPLRILAWGDSVTESAYLPPESKWQSLFAARLRARYPQASVTVASVSRNGGTSAFFLQAPAGSPHNFAEKVLAVKPDLIVSEFINDASLDEAGVLKQHGGLLNAFRGIGAEWVILTPHFSRPDWMGLRSENRIEADPRPYVRGLRRFTENNGVALADASARWVRLWRQGLPYSTLLVNNINHPDERGMGLFADALMALFP